jgi:endonuclease/exonuclease/phosphatase family metal-dependent hydrolase
MQRVTDFPPLFAQAGVEPSSRPLEHNLRPYFEQLSRFESIDELRRSEIYKRLEPEINRTLTYVLKESFSRNPPCSERPVIRATSWNIERGIELENIVEVLSSHPIISSSDLLLLTELDYGMARSGNRNVAGEIARALELNYAFAPSYLNLSKGSGMESKAEGQNRLGLHGNALFSRYPLTNVGSIQLPNGKDKMQGNEKRLGSQAGVAAIVKHSLGSFRAVSVHLDAHSTQKHRMRQMQLVLRDLKQRSPHLPALIGGDWNTSTFNSSNAFFTIMGYVRRVLMGVPNVIRNHYPYPDRWFERHLFRELEREGYQYKNLNAPGACTLHYDINDLAANGRMADWIPNWCFWFINWALAKNNGRCSFKLDWFAGKDIDPSGDFPPTVVDDVHTADKLLSDHDPIVLDFLPSGNNSKD